MFSGHLSVRPLSVHSLTPIARDVLISLYCGKGLQ